ncbi:MAG: SDR family oxidoreductase [Bacteroidia bacterium]
MSKKTILVTGCTKGIGLAIVREFAAKGFQVAGCARNKEELTALFTELSTNYPQQQFFMEVCDVSNIDLLKIFAADVVKEFGNIDVLVNNAGVFKPGSICEEEEGAFELQINTNLASAYHLTRAIVPVMKQNKSGHIFNICSTASITAYTNGGSYCISKFAMLGMSKVLREELKSFQIKVSSVLPGATLTNSWAGSDLPEERFMPAEDVAKIISTVQELSYSTNVEEIIMRPLAGDIN